MTSGAPAVFGAVAFQPLKRLAPSRFASFQECPLRESFRAAGAPRLLAPTGAAHLGSVIHKLMETTSSRGALTEGAATVAFDHLVREEETRMAAAPQSRSAVPLSRSVADFHVRRLRAIHAAANASPVRRPTALHGTAGPPTGAEIWVSTKEGDVGGFIDEVVNRAGKIVLRDFKTGMAAHRGSPLFARALVQLQLYAALYAETWAVWPVELEVVPIGGEALAEQVNSDACAALLARAREALRTANAVLTSAPLDAMRQLARPAPEACRYCDYRPLCAPYLAARRGEGEWPRDVAGMIVRRDTLRNGTLLFGVQDGAVTAHIRGVSSDPVRHAALPLAVVGKMAGFFNLSGSREHHSYMEVQNTTIVSPSLM